MVSSTAIVTDALTDGFYFPLFMAHYQRQLPGAVIHVVTPAGRGAGFAAWPVQVVELTQDYYDDTVRAAAITALVADLLTRFQTVVRVDVDELLIADPRHHASLGAYLAQEPADYLTARGYDVVAAPDAPPIDLSRPVLGAQRRHAFALYALNKTCVTRRPLRWGRGFHGCEERPRFGQLFLIHMKRADIVWQARFGQFISAQVRDDAYVRDYYLTPLENLRGFHEMLFSREIRRGWEAMEDAAFLARFEADLRLGEDGLWGFDFLIAEYLIELPPAFYEIF